MQAQLSALNRTLSTIFSIVQDTDSAPTTQVVRAANEAQATFRKTAAAWTTLKASVR